MICQFGQCIDVLVNHQDRLPGVLQHGKASPDLFTNNRGQAFGRLIKDQQTRIGHQRTADGQHLLFPTGKIGTAMRQAFAQTREQVQNRIHCPHGLAITRRTEKCAQILADTQIGEYLPSLGHQTDTRARQLKRFHVVFGLSEPCYGPTGRLDLPHDCPHRGGLAHTVAPHQRDTCARVYREADTKQDLRRTISRFYILKLQHLRSPNRRRAHLCCC